MREVCCACEFIYKGYKMTAEQLTTLFNIVMETNNGCTIIYPSQYEPVGERGYGNVEPEDMAEPFLLSWGEDCNTNPGSSVNFTMSLTDFLEEVQNEINKLKKEYNETR